MKKAICVLFALLFAAAVFCACGEKDESGKTSSGGKESWVGVEFPKGTSFSSAKLQFNESNFTLTLNTEQITSTIEGHCKDIGNGEKALYADKQKQIKNSTNSTIFEKDVETSLSEKRPLYTKVSEDGKLTLNDNGKQIVFERE